MMIYSTTRSLRDGTQEFILPSSSNAGLGTTTNPQIAFYHLPSFFLYEHLLPVKAENSHINLRDLQTPNHPTLPKICIRPILFSIVQRSLKSSTPSTSKANTANVKTIQTTLHPMLLDSALTLRRAYHLLHVLTVQRVKRDLLNLDIRYGVVANIARSQPLQLKLRAALGSIPSIGEFLFFGISRRI